MTKALPRLTLAMPVFNGSNFVGDAIAAILDQSYGDFELIISDNASDDGTPDIVSSFERQDKRIRFIRNKQNIGAAANYNLGFSRGSGELFKWCAHDDRLSQNFLATCVSALEGDTSLSIAFGATQGLTAENEIVPLTGHETPSLLSSDPAERFRQAIELSGTCFPIFGVFRRAQLERSTLHRPYYGSDRALIAEMAIMGKFSRMERAIFYNREHAVRSINIDDKLVRSAWQTGQANRSGKQVCLRRTHQSHTPSARNFGPAWRNRTGGAVTLHRVAAKPQAAPAGPIRTGTGRRDFSQAGVCGEGLLRRPRFDALNQTKELSSQC